MKKFAWARWALMIFKNGVTPLHVIIESAAITAELTTIRTDFFMYILMDVKDMFLQGGQLRKRLVTLRAFVRLELLVDASHVTR